MNRFALTIDGSTIDLPSSVPSGGLNNLELILRNFMMVFLFTGVCFVVIYIVWGAIQWIMSEGDKQKLTAARGKVTWAIIGFIILLLSYTIINIVGFLFRINLLKLQPI